MSKTRIVSNLEISQTADELVIRGRRKDVVLWIVLACLLVPFSLTLVYQNLVGTADVPAVWTRPGRDQVFVAITVLLCEFFFGVMPIIFLVVSIRKRRRSWVFDRPRGELTRLGQHWALADLRAVAVDVRRGEGFFRGAAPESAAVLLHFGDDQKLEIARFHAGKHYSLQSRIGEATELANAVGDFLQLPVRHPPRANQGFDVVLPAQS